MGQAVSVAKRAVSKVVETVVDTSNDAAKKKAEEAKTRIDTLMQDLQNKLHTFESRVKASRGPSESETEIDGGRSVMRVSEIRIATDAGVVPQLKNAIGSFIKLAQGGEPAKKAAVEGAESLLTTGLDALFGVANGASMEKQGFVVMFLNYAFVRVDYFIYTYNIGAEKFGAQANTAGCCYLADLAVLKLEELKTSEIDFLISQSLKSGDTMERVKKLTALKLQLGQSAVLSRLLKDAEADDLTAILNATKAYMKTQNEIAAIFKSMPNFEEIDVTNKQDKQ